jgi:uncharacterized protein (TIGR02246 family)
MRSRVLLGGAFALVLGGCQAKPAAFNPDDPAVVAAVDSIMDAAMQGAASVDADRVMTIAEGPGEFSFITGDIMLQGDSAIRERFRTTYLGVARQDQSVTARKVRLVAPDVALFTAVGEGTYTDKAGWTSPPVGLGLTVVFVRDPASGRWQAQHAHQSLAE